MDAVQRLAVVSRFCMNGNFMRTWFFGTAACCTATSLVFIRMMKWTFVLLWKMLVYKMPLRSLACHVESEFNMTLGHDTALAEYDAQSSASSHGKRKEAYLYTSSFTFLHSSSDNYEVLAELTSVADAVWMWATHEATLEEWDLSRGMFSREVCRQESYDVEHGLTLLVLVVNSPDKPVNYID